MRRCGCTGVPDGHVLLVRCCGKFKKEGFMVFRSLFKEGMGSTLSHTITCIITHRCGAGIAVSIASGNFCLDSSKGVKKLRSFGRLAPRGFRAVLAGSLGGARALTSEFERYTKESLVALEECGKRSGSINHRRIHKGVLLGFIRSVSRGFSVLGRTEERTLRSCVSVGGTGGMVSVVSDKTVRVGAVGAMVPDPFTFGLISRKCLSMLGRGSGTRFAGEVRGTVLSRVGSGLGSVC